MRRRRPRSLHRANMRFVVVVSRKHRTLSILSPFFRMTPLQLQLHHVPLNIYFPPVRLSIVAGTTTRSSSCLGSHGRLTLGFLAPPLSRTLVRIKIFYQPSAFVQLGLPASGDLKVHPAVTTLSTRLPPRITHRNIRALGGIWPARHFRFFLVPGFSWSLPW